MEASILAKIKLSKPLKCLANFSICLLVVSQVMHHGVYIFSTRVKIHYYETIRLSTLQNIFNVSSSIKEEMWFRHIYFIFPPQLIQIPNAQEL